MSKIIVIADSHKAFQKSFRELIQNTSRTENVIVEVSNRNELIDLISQHIPDIIFIDFYLGQEQTTSIIKDILKCNPGIIIIALSFYDEQVYINSMLNAGVKGYLLKNADNKELIELILTNPKGGLIFSHEINLKMNAS